MNAAKLNTSRSICSSMEFGSPFHYKSPARIVAQKSENRIQSIITQNKKDKKGTTNCLIFVIDIYSNTICPKQKEKKHRHSLELEEEYNPFMTGTKSNRIQSISKTRATGGLSDQRELVSKSPNTVYNKTNYLGNIMKK